MDQFRTLFLMQLKEKMDISFLKSAKRMALKVLQFVLEFAVVCVVAYVILWMCQYFNLFTPLGRLPVGVMSVVFAVMFLFSIITCTVSLSKNLFQSKDNAVLFALPASSETLFFSKLAVYLINEMRRTFLFLVPVFIAYAILASLKWYAYIWIIVMLAIFTVFLVLFAGLLSIPIHYVVRFFNRFTAAKLIGVLVILGLAVWFIVWIIGIIPDDVNLIKNWVAISQTLRNALSWFQTHLYIFYAFTLFLCGRYDGTDLIFWSKYSWAVFLILIGCIIVLAGLNYLISHYLYNRVAVPQYTDSGEKENKPARNRKRGGFASSCVYESLRLLRAGGVLGSTVASIIIIPCVTVLINTVYSAIATRTLGDYMIVAFNVMIVLLLATSSNVWTASIYSRDGESLPLRSAMPQKPFPMLFSRLAYSFFATILMVVPSCVIFMIMADMATLDGILLAVFMLLICFGHILWSAEMDFTHPRIEAFKTSGAAASTPSEAKSVVLSFILSAVALGLVLFFLTDTGNLPYVRVLVIAAIFLAYRFVTFWFRSRTMYGFGEDKE
ncbi:MAG: hypothetical protein LUD51_05020 [Clostridia bacterium]|nr:hypothetical protein [Clostridia bacterium]